MNVQSRYSPEIPLAGGPIYWWAPRAGLTRKRPRTAGQGKAWRRFGLRKRKFSCGRTRVERLMATTHSWARMPPHARRCRFTAHAKAACGSRVRRNRRARVRHTAVPAEPTVFASGDFEVSRISVAVSQVARKALGGRRPDGSLVSLLTCMLAEAEAGAGVPVHDGARCSSGR